MTRSKLQRIAFVQLSPNGKLYPMKCNREDLGNGDDVEVLMSVGSENERYQDGKIISVSYERWNCSCHVVNHVREVSYEIENGGLIRTVNLTEKS